MKTCAMILALAASASGAAAEPAGLRLGKYEMPHHGSEAAVAIWYPGAGGGKETIYANSPVFQGVEASIGADIRPGQYPVVLFSHGMGGADRSQAWLASELAGRGAIVVMVNHPNSTWGDFDMSKGVKHWTRATDLSVALDTLAADPEFAGHIDTSRIMAAGFSYGGWTALSLGGMTGNLDGIVDACTAHIDRIEACDMLLSDAVSMQTEDADSWNASYTDRRVTHVAAIDPGFVWGLEASNIRALVPQMLLIGLGGAADRMLAADFDQSGLADLLPDARITRIDPAFHFTAMPLCTAEAEDILKERKDDPVCTDPPGTDRAAVHAVIIDAISDMLGL